MTRLERLTRDGLDPEQRELFDQIASGERASRNPNVSRVGPDGALEGPFNAMLRSARLGLALQEVGAQVRFHSSLSDRCRELAILIVATAEQSTYERYVHEQVGRSAGLTDDEMAAVRTGADPGLGDPVERAVLATVWALANHRDLDDTEFREAVGVLGERATYELLALVGYYQLLALSLRVFRVTPPEVPAGL